LNKPLEDRFNPTQWIFLLDKALPALDAVYAGEGGKVWTLGEGTAMALRISHRLSDDIDIFVPGIELEKFVPTHNPDTMAISTRFQWVRLKPRGTSCGHFRLPVL